MTKLIYFHGIFFIIFSMKLIFAAQNNTKITLKEISLTFDEEKLENFGEMKDFDNLFHYFDIKFAFAKLKSLKSTFSESLNRFNLKMKNNLFELDIFNNFEDMTAFYKYQVSCNICKKTFKTSQYLWIHTTRAHIQEKYNETDIHYNVFWLSSLSEFIEWNNGKKYDNKEYSELTKNVYLKFKKCMLFAKNYIDYNDDLQKIYDFCLDFYYEKESKGKIQDIFMAGYKIFFKVLLVVFVIMSLVYYCFVYYIYLDAKEEEKNKKNQE